MLRHLLPLAAVLISPHLQAQTAPDTATVEPAMIVRGVQLHRRDIFDPNERSWFAKLVNGLHIVTQPAVIRRELLIKPGKPYDSALVAESERNLRALGIFRRVQIDSVRTPDGLMLRVLAKDGWSTQADWRFRSTGGEVAFTIGLIENNLLGTASAAAVRYRRDPDRSTVAMAFRRPRLFAGAVGLGLGYENKSDGETVGVTVEQPFFSLTAGYGFRFDAHNREERVLLFRNGLDLASDTLSRRYTLIRGSAAKALRASSAGYLRLGMAGQVRRDDFLPEAATAAFPRSVTGAVGAYLVLNRARFIVTRGYAGFAREEDVDLGTTVRVGLVAAPKLFGYARDGLGPELGGRVGAVIPGGFAFLDVAANGLFTSAGLDSGSVQIAATTVFQPGPRHMAVFHADAGWLENPVPGEEFDLGLGSGPRGFGSHAFTGDRSMFLSAEYRYTIADDLFRMVGLGVAAFVDYGGAWYAGSPRRTGWDAGVGLRLGASRSSDTDALRFDL
ncbi:MAG TPA: POTRA domain-containing protein, partial [Gemmatimonadales bacterium]|nr:POTRA domain-containing protein [Gemmatimonadales bacterium]